MKRHRLLWRMWLHIKRKQTATLHSKSALLLLRKEIGRSFPSRICMSMPYSWENHGVFVSKPIWRKRMPLRNAMIRALLRPGYGFTVYWGQGLLEIRQLGIWHARSWNKISFQTGRNAVRNLRLSLFRGRCRVCTNSVLRYVICTLHTPKAMLRG